MTTNHSESTNHARSAVHASFVIERLMPATPAQVFAAFAEPEAKARWFVGPPGQWKKLVRELDFRVGGRERVSGAFANGTVSTFDCRYHDIVADERILYTYDMLLDERRISVSLSTLQLRAEGAGTRMHYTEQVVFLDGYDDGGSRERGTQKLFDQVEAWLRGQPVA
ncbi:SRPBCC family protein [Nannocystis pusilla]|uniref:SRPBCC family protein n=1 Tax=Nannocystis pusilla TaxID=889268 RepID=A0ABS7TQ29_9BACT|nr:SRPBCC family protein [Nannocystis pusilla]MBZ5710252.1 SRPBCC family protein [Nannocystis pusilla]